MSTLPTDSDDRKNYPLMSGCLNYFPAALAGVARWSRLGNDKHNKGQPLHHARGKSMDHGDCIIRHLIDLQALLTKPNRIATDQGDADIKAMMDEADAIAWRALALSQELHERFAGAPLAPAAKLPMYEQITAGIKQSDKHVAEGINDSILKAGGVESLSLLAAAPTMAFKGDTNAYSPAAGVGAQCQGLTARSASERSAAEWREQQFQTRKQQMIESSRADERKGGDTE
jgi:hypothetical protein